LHDNFKQETVTEIDSIAKKLINRMEILGLGPSGPIVPKALRSYSSTPQINKT